MGEGPAVLGTVIWTGLPPAAGIALTAGAGMPAGPAGSSRPMPMICCKGISAAESCCYGSGQCKTGQLAATMPGRCRRTANGAPSREQY